MKPRSAKNKGKRLQNKVRDLILEKFQQLEEDDVRSTTMGDSGEDVLLSPAARKLFPFSVECKNQEKLNIWSALEQTENNSEQLSGEDLSKQEMERILDALEREEQKVQEDVKKMKAKSSNKKVEKDW